MKLEKYEDLEISSDALEYKFLSIGPKGNISKIVQFKATAISNVFNLAFGNQAENGVIDDLAVDNNKDRNKILVTVVSIVYQFTMQFPNNLVFLLVVQSKEHDYTEWQFL